MEEVGAAAAAATLYAVDDKEANRVQTLFLQHHQADRPYAPNSAHSKFK